MIAYQTLNYPYSRLVMNIFELKQLFTECETAAFQLRVLHDDPLKIIQLRDYLQVLAKQADEDELSPVDIFNLIKIISTEEDFSLLDEAKLINECGLYLLVENVGPKQPLFTLCECLAERDFIIKVKWLPLLLPLSERNIQRLARLTLRLAAKKLLHEASFEAALKRIAFILPLVEEATVVKNSRKLTGQPRSELIINDQLRFFMGHQEEKDEGSFGVVKKGYKEEDGSLPAFSIKHLKELDYEEASREVKYQRLLGREAYYFTRKNRLTIVSEWQKEKSLHQFSALDLKQTAFEKRLVCLISLLTELNFLHLHYRVHGDIKAQNVILDLKNLLMKLIDFGAAHKEGSCKVRSYTAYYADPKLKAGIAYSFCDDIYALGIVVAFLFPDFFSVGLESYNTQICLHRSPLLIEHGILLHLIKALLNPDRKKRCTCEDALQFCQAVVQHYPSLDMALVTSLSETLLNRSTVTEEDIFRGAIKFPI